MYCENCGKRIPDESQFCPECGAPVHHHQESPVARARKGDNAAVQQLMNDYRGMVRYQARMYVKNEDDINEIEQETFIQAFKNLNRLDDDNRFGGWLKTIAVNTSKNYVTTAFRRKSVMFTDLDDTNNNMVYDARDERIDHRPEVQMDETSRREIITKVLDDLPETQRMIIVMHYYDNLSFKDIAEQLNIPMSTVTGRAQMAKNSIKESVTEIQDRDGIKLYHLSPIAFFIWLLGLERTAPVTPAVFGKTVRIDPQKIAAKDQPHYGNPANNAGRTIRAEKAVKTTVKTTAKATAGKAAVGATAKAAGTGFLATAAGKAVIAGAIAVAAVGGSTAGIYYHNTKNAEIQKSELNQSDRKSDEKDIFNEKNLVWIAEPGTIDLVDFEDFETKNISYHNGYEENIGYSHVWPGFVKSYDLTGNNNVYSGNEIIGKKDGKTKIYSFDGKEIKAVPHDQSKDDKPYSDEITEKYDQSYTFISDNQVYQLSQLSSNYYDIGCKPGGEDLDSSEFKNSITTPVILPVKNGLGCDDITEAVKDPDGFMVTGHNQDAVNIPKGMTPSYYPDYLKNEKANTRNVDECFVNGVIKLQDKDGKIHLWNADTQKYVSDEAFKDTTYFENGYIGIQKNKKWAFMDIDGKRVTDYVFDKVSGIYEGKAYVRYKDKTGILDLKASLKKEGNSKPHESDFAFLAGRKFYYSSGAGAWGTSMTITGDDGSFEGDFHDSNMGDIGSDHPKGQCYESDFTGKFTDLKKIDDLTYQMTLESMKYARTPGESEIIDETLIDYTEPEGLTVKDVYTIHLPGTKISSLSEMQKLNLQWTDMKDSDVTNCILITDGEDNLPFME